MMRNSSFAWRAARIAVLCSAALIAACGGGSSSTSTTTPGLVVQATEDPIQVIAKTGPIVGILLGDPVQLDGSQSYLMSLLPGFATTKDGLTYDWSFTHVPEGSTAALQNANTVSPNFVPDVAGTYIAQLTVSGRGATSKRAIETIVVAPQGTVRITGKWIHENLPTTCYSCHFGLVTSSTGTIDIGKSPNHAATSNACEACHAPTAQGFSYIPYVDHNEVFGQCSQCHNGVTAIGKSTYHQATDAECNTCHNTVSFITLDANGKFDHSSISGLCSRCHNGKVAIGMPATTADTPAGTHPVTTSECGYCHTTQTFATPYPDHTGPDVVGHQCTECHNHNGTLAKALPTDHPDMGVDCQVCHSVTTFSMGGIFNHALVDPSVVRCDTCHNNTNTGTSTIKAIGTNDDPTPPHPATKGGDCGACHIAPSEPRAPNALGFAGVTSFDHTGVTNGCQNCHGITATGKPAPTALSMHMPTNPDNPGTANDEDCGNCHSPGTFATGYFDHTDHANGNTPITSGCNACHDNVITVGKLPNHIATFPDNQDCADCHTTGAFKPATFNHASVSTYIDTDCAQCHDGNISTGMNAVTHIPVPSGQDCSVCHTYTALNQDSSTAPFKLNTVLPYQHTGITGNCESCHNGNADYAAVGAIGKNANHIPALNNCYACHQNTGTGAFADASVFMATQHSALTGGCESCHTSKFLPTANGNNQNVIKVAATHIPTGQDCNVCHTNTVGGFSQGASIFTHKGIVGNCVSCHDGSWTSVLGPNNVGALGMTPTTSQGGSHPDTSADCLYCHTTTTFTEHTVDHSSPAVTSVRCDSCHFDGTTISGALSKANAPNPPGHPTTSEDCRVCHTPGGTFAGTAFDHSLIAPGTRCDSCHNSTNATGLDAYATTHGGTPHPDTLGKDCGSCHAPGAGFAGATYDHTGIVNNCASCHNGNTARGQIPPPNHVPTSEDCSVCHQTTGFKPATFSHAGIVDNCSSCHDAGFATGKPANHVVTIKDCGVCHSIGTTFAGTTIDHSSPDVTAKQCMDCHDGSVLGALSKADAPAPGHLATTLDCGNCHTTGTFVGGGWVHGPETANTCKNCHDYNGNGYTPAFSGHINTTEQCDVCHTTKAWSPGVFNHSSTSTYTVKDLGSHRKALTCTNCHGSTIGGGADMQWLPSKQPQYAPDCAACHANNFRSVSRHNGGKSGTVDQNKNCGASGCHRVSSSGFG